MKRSILLGSHSGANFVIRTAKINGLQITFVKLRFKTLYKRKNSLLLSRSLLLFSVVKMIFSNFQVTKVKELPSSIMNKKTLLN